MTQGISISVQVYVPDAVRCSAGATIDGTILFSQYDDDHCTMQGETKQRKKTYSDAVGQDSLR